MPEFMGNHCYGAGNIPELHKVDTVREIEYRGDASLPWEKRALCEGCIADLRHAGMQIKGEPPITSVQSQLYIDGAYDDDATGVPQ